MERPSISWKLLVVKCNLTVRGRGNFYNNLEDTYKESTAVIRLYTDTEKVPIRKEV